MIGLDLLRRIGLCTASSIPLVSLAMSSGKESRCGLGHVTLYCTNKRPWMDSRYLTDMVTSTLNLHGMCRDINLKLNLAES